jgi:hypothetical protein
MMNIFAWYYSVYERTNYTRNCRNDFFYQSRIHYLGHVMSSEGIVVDTSKVEAIMEWIAPMNMPEVRSFMGLAGYYRWFV